MVPVPPSVLAYYTQFDVQTAIDLMRGARDPKVPPNLRWEDVGNFYRARLAAVQLPIEYAIFLESLWRAVWSDLPAGWVASKPGGPLRPDLAIGVTTVWNEVGFNRAFIRGDYQLELMVGLDVDDGLQLGVVLYDADGAIPLDADRLSGWVQPEPDYPFWTEEAVVPLGETVPVKPFKRWTDQAWAAIAEATASA